MEYYWAMKKNESMPLAATRMQLDIIILSEMSQTKTKTKWYDLYMGSLEKEKSTNELVYQTETDT